MDKAIADSAQRAIDACLACHAACLSTAMGHCLEAGGRHTEPHHFRLMLACAEVCRTAAHLMLLRSEQHGGICAECALICEACARDCEGLDGMEACAEACRRCAAACREMAG